MIRIIEFLSRNLFDLRLTTLEISGSLGSQGREKFVVQFEWNYKYLLFKKHLHTNWIHVDWNVWLTLYRLDFAKDSSAVGCEDDIL